MVQMEVVTYRIELKMEILILGIPGMNWLLEGEMILQEIRVLVEI